MKVSIITAVYNGESFIGDCMRSVSAQNHSYIEHIVIDGKSTDRTLDIVRQNSTPIVKIVSEKDVNLYDAMNKGLALTTGDIIGILNADDFYRSPDVISTVVQKFKETNSQVVIGDLELVDPVHTSKVKRRLSAKNFKVEDFLKGEAPPHPPFFVRKELYEKYGTFNIKYPVCADFELMLRFLYLNKVPWVHLPMTLIRMRTGGLSDRGILSKIRLNSAKLKICRSHNLKTNLFKMYARYFSKGLQLFSEKMASY